ncbi:transposase [Alteriqipengyuania flavescens]|uniref:transposase n=1 Tax=Alteriqipengyuania flavescens TaxID=3053610 RepID=UPI0025B37C39|nr:transposase [Alteriqipengyuania flavescens]WJY18691.1 transposase [Alteriqipengyuania flavescens]WJY24631.1 transposase [Alteriqipengyuania flavescens]
MTGVPKFLSAKQIADMALEGLPTTKRGVNKVAQRDRWTSKKRCGPGGGRLYAVSSLPVEAQNDLLARAGEVKRKLAASSSRGRGRPKGSGAFFVQHPEIAQAVAGWVACRKVSASIIREMIVQHFDEAPCLRVVQKQIATFERDNELVLESFRDPSRFKSTRRVSLGRADAGITYANQLWELDTTPGDVLLVEGRRAILGVIDVFSRRVRFLVAPSESAQSVRRLLASTMQAWGAQPTAVATDQGSGYINKAIVSALELLGIEHRDCPPASPEKKPFIERVFGTFQRQRSEILAGYCGHDVAEAQRLRERARKDSGKPLIVPEMTAVELQVILDNWADGTYLQARHSTLGTTPLARWQSSPPGATRAPSSDELRIVLSALVGERTVGKKGVVWQRGSYWHPALVPFIGKTVTVRRDEDELGELMVFDEDRRFLCTAVNHERSGLSEEDFARAARRDQDEWMKAARAGLSSKMRRYRIEDARDAILRADAERAGKLVAFPSRTVAEPSDTVRSIRAAADAAPPKPTALRQGHSAGAPEPTEADLDARVREADQLLAAADRGETVDEARLRWARSFVTRSTYLTRKFPDADFSGVNLSTREGREAAYRQFQKASGSAS